MSIDQTKQQFINGWLSNSPNTNQEMSFMTKFELRVDNVINIILNSSTKIYSK